MNSTKYIMMNLAIVVIQLIMLIVQVRSSNSGSNNKRRSPPTKGFAITWDESPIISERLNDNRSISTPAHAVGTINFDTGKWENSFDNNYFYSYGATSSHFNQKTNQVVSFALLPFDDIGHISTFSLQNISGTKQAVWNSTRVVDVDKSPGEIQCDISKSSCYGFTFGNKEKDNALTKFNINKDKFQLVVNLGDYDGYTIDASCLNKEKNLYHAILVCLPSDAMAKEQNNKLSHRVQNNFMKRKNRQVTYYNNQNNHNNNNQTTLLSATKTVIISKEGSELSDQCLVTIDLNENKIINSVPVSKDLMGPFIYDPKFGVITFSPTIENCACSTINYKNGDESCLYNGTFGGFPSYHQLSSNDNGYFFGQFIRPNTTTKLGLVVGDLWSNPIKLIYNMSWDFDIHAPVLLN